MHFDDNDSFCVQAWRFQAYRLQQIYQKYNQSQSAKFEMIIFSEMSC